MVDTLNLILSACILIPFSDKGIDIKINSIWAIGKASKNEIDKINILQASLLAMKRAIKKLVKKPNLVIIDGNKTPKIKN